MIHILNQCRFSGGKNICHHSEIKNTSLLKFVFGKKRCCTELEKFPNQSNCPYFERKYIKPSSPPSRPKEEKDNICMT